MTTLLIATRNQHKVGEIRAILGGDFRYMTLNDLPDAHAVTEDADTFAGNATKKTVELAQWLAGTQSAERGMRTEPVLVLADDSGLEVDFLNGAPGVHSARFAALETGKAGNSSDADNNRKLLRLLEGVPLEKRSSRFRCVLALMAVERRAASAEGSTAKLFEGVCEGRIGFEPRGDNGFGYDPLFIPQGWQQSFAELGDETKNQLSHRARALARLKVRLDSIANR
jgi:XTP/dITP diphosphohydrolase